MILKTCWSSGYVSIFKYYLADKLTKPWCYLLINCTNYLDDWSYVIFVTGYNEPCSDRFRGPKSEGWSVVNLSRRELILYYENNNM